VHDELVTLERARSALAAGEATRALSILDTYSAGFPRASMADEATVLRIQALALAGDMAAAHRVAEAFLASRPQSPYAAHIRSLLGGASKP
jgi:outer membrane protein assembly factor BamD (BamD/ComL family)